jgi:hypothetical protein
MKTMTIALLFCVLAAGSLNAQQPPLPPELLAASAQRVSAIQRSAAMSMGNVLADDFIWIDANGTTRTKLDLMKSIASNDNPAPPLSNDAFHNPGSTHRVFGDTVVRMWQTAAAPKAQGIEVWSKINGEWKMTLLQFTPIK